MGSQHGDGLYVVSGSKLAGCFAVSIMNKCVTELIGVSCGSVNTTYCVEEIEVLCMRFQVLCVVSVKVLV